MRAFTETKKYQWLRVACDVSKSHLYSDYCLVLTLSLFVPCYTLPGVRRVLLEHMCGRQTVLIVTHLAECTHCVELQLHIQLEE